VYHALRNSPKWDKTVFIINYDEWGGFYDHVIPPRADADDSVVPGSPFDFHLRGFRVPCIVMSPFAPATVAHAGPFDHTSVLKLIEWRWNLAPLTARDASTDVGNLVDVLDFDHGCGDVVTRLMPDIEAGESGDDLRAEAERRDPDELYAALDLAECLGWAIGDEELHLGLSPGDVEPYVVWERHRALQWIHGGAW
jgi:hypothetical protein